MQRWFWILAMLCACDDGASVDQTLDAAQDALIRDAAPADAAVADDAARPDALGTQDARVDDPDMPVVGCIDGTVDMLGACGLNNRGARSRRCEDGRFGAPGCTDPDVCVDGATQVAECPAGQGMARCLDGQWGPAENCVEPTGLCPPETVLVFGEAWRGVVGNAGQWVSGCGGNGGETTATFMAPETATYRFDLGESDFDTVLSLRRVCAEAGSEVICNDDSAGTRSVIEHPMVEGESLTVVVDAFDDGGAFVLQIVEVECPADTEERRRCEDAGELPAEETRFCRPDGWTEWTPCAVFGECLPGTVEVIERRCEDGSPGEQERECDAEGDWSNWSACVSTGQCFQGVSEWADCDDAGTQHQRTCQADQTWGDWSDCFGAICPAQRQAQLGTQRDQLAPIASAVDNDCGNQGGTANTLTFTPAADGNYAFWLQTPRPALSIRDACDDGQTSIACDTYRRVAFEFRPEHATITTPLSAGESVTLLAGSEGLPDRVGQGYALNIDHRDPDRCVDEPVDNHHWSRAVFGDAIAETFDGSLGLLSADQCAGEPDWFAVDVPMGCNLVFTPLRTLYGRASVGIRRPSGTITRDSGLLGPFSRIIGVSQPGTHRVFIEAGVGDEPQTLVSSGLACGNFRRTQCSRGLDNVGNDDAEMPAQIVPPEVFSEPICGGDVDHFEWAQGPNCHSRLTLACDLETVSDLTVELTDAEGLPIPVEQIRPEPGFGPLKAGWVVDRPVGTASTRLRLQSDAVDADGRCDLRVDEICFDDPCRGVGSVVGDYGIHASTFCENSPMTTLRAPDVAPGCTLSVERIGGDPVQLVMRDGSGEIVAEGPDGVEYAPDANTDLTVEVRGIAGAPYVLDAGVRCL